MKKAIITLTFLSLCFASAKADYISDMKRRERIAKDPKFRNVNPENCGDAYDNCSKNKELCKLCDIKYYNDYTREY
jgi:hypothetical protein